MWNVAIYEYHFQNMSQRKCSDKLVEDESFSFESYCIRFIICVYAQLVYTRKRMHIPF